MRSKETRLLSMFQPFSLKVEKSFASNAREVDICQSDPIGDNPVTRRFRTKHFAAGLLVQSNCTTLGGLPMTRPLHVFGIALATRPVHMPWVVSRQAFQLGQQLALRDRKRPWAN